MPPRPAPALAGILALLLIPALAPSLHGDDPLDPSLAARAADAICGFEDRANGGFGGAPKFPQPVMLELLEAAAADRPALLDVVERALDGMSIGGLFDHVGGGFHRYAVDATWTVPHFEKMLYD
ncbi:MAG: N-acylglucosamine 2-epimerase, partial [Planctomycetota bacterium]